MSLQKLTTPWGHDVNCNPAKEIVKGTYDSDRMGGYGISALYIRAT